METITDSKSPATSSRAAQMRNIAFEALLVGAAAAAVAFAANALSPRGLKLTRNYFPGATNNVVATPAASALSGIRQKGLQWVDARKAFQLFQAARSQRQLIVFIDARDETQYREGHIPGAFEFDSYYPAEYLATVLPACQLAEHIVVYCNGGDCEDSQFAAVTLRDAGIPNEKLSVFVGGMDDWVTNHWPVEIGDRNSGNVRKPMP
jgi:rhodanese-related sulfurtransferase